MSRWRRLVAAGLLALAAATPAIAGEDWQARLDHWVRQGFDRPDAALAALQRDEAWADTPEWARLTAQGSVLARDGQGDRDARALAIAERLRALAQRHDERLALAGAQLIDALRFERQGRFELAASHAREALAEHGAACLRDDGRAPRAGCDWRLAWRARHTLGQHAVSLGVQVDAQLYWETARQLAHANGGAYQAALSAAMLAGLQAQSGELERAAASLEQARQLARGLPAADDLWVRLKISESRLARGRGQTRESLDALLQARTRAEAAGLPRTEAIVQANLSDIWIRSGRPEEALVAAEFALPVAQLHQELRTERVVRHNIVLARLALGQLAPARRELDAVLELWRASGARGDEVLALREFADALAAAGDAKSALALYHRERQLSAEIARLNRDSMLREIRSRNDQAAKQREIELLRKEAAVQEAQLANRGLLQSLWLVAGFGLLLALVGLVLLVGRVRRARSRLVRSRARLRTQSERDALTGPGQPSPRARPGARARPDRALRRRAAAARRRPLQAHQRRAWPCRRRRGAGRGGRAPERRAARAGSRGALGRRGVPGHRAGPAAGAHRRCSPSASGARWRGCRCGSAPARSQSRCRSGMRTFRCARRAAARCRR